MQKDFPRNWQRRFVHATNNLFLVSFISSTHISLFCLSNLFQFVISYYRYVWIHLENIVEIPQTFHMLYMQSRTIYPSLFYMWSLSCAPRELRLDSYPPIFFSSLQFYSLFSLLYYHFSSQDNLWATSHITSHFMFYEKFALSVSKHVTNLWNLVLPRKRHLIQQRIWHLEQPRKKKSFN